MDPPWVILIWQVVGGLIWDENGDWIMGFARNIGITTSFQVPRYGQFVMVFRCVLIGNFLMLKLI